MSANESASDDDTEFDLDRAMQLHEKAVDNDLTAAEQAELKGQVDAIQLLYDHHWDAIRAYIDAYIDAWNTMATSLASLSGDDKVLARKKSADRCQKCDHRATVTAMKMFGDGDRTYRKVTCRDDECGHVHLEEESDQE